MNKKGYALLIILILVVIGQAAYTYIILQFTMDYQLFHNYYYTCN